MDTDKRKNEVSNICRTSIQHLRSRFECKFCAEQKCLLVALFSSAIQEGIQSGSEVFTDLLLQNRVKIPHYAVTAKTRRTGSGSKNMLQHKHPRFLRKNVCGLTVDLLRRNASASSTKSRSL